MKVKQTFIAGLCLMIIADVCFSLFHCISLPYSKEYLYKHVERCCPNENIFTLCFKDDNCYHSIPQKTLYTYEVDGLLHAIYDYFCTAHHAGVLVFVIFPGTILFLWLGTIKWTTLELLLYDEMFILHIIGVVDFRVWFVFLLSLLFLRLLCVTSVELFHRICAHTLFVILCMSSLLFAYFSIKISLERSTQIRVTFPSKINGNDVCLLVDSLANLENICLAGREISLNGLLDAGPGRKFHVDDIWNLGFVIGIVLLKFFI